MEIHGVKQELIIPCKLDIQDNIVTITSEFDISLSDFNIKIPKIVNQKISNNILINVDALLK